MADVPTMERSRTERGAAKLSGRRRGTEGCATTRTPLSAAPPPAGACEGRQRFLLPGQSRRVRTCEC